MASSTPFPTIPPHIDELLGRLHERSRSQEAAIDAASLQRIRASADHASLDALMADKFIALDRDKALFMYELILATGATRVVEVGTSFGVSTIYLALAVARNAARKGVAGSVVATEKEPLKAEVARGYWREAGPAVEGVIDLRVGDLTETLAKDVGEVDFVLMDIWPHVALPAIQLLLPHMKPGAVVLTDNVVTSAPRYGPLFGVIRDPNGRFMSVNMPYEGGLEMSVLKE